MPLACCSPHPPGCISFSPRRRRPPTPTLFPYTTLFRSSARPPAPRSACRASRSTSPATTSTRPRSEEHTSELQSPCNLVCRLLLEKKKAYDKELAGDFERRRRE